MIGRVNTGGGGSGGTLVVTGIAGDSVAAAKDSKTYTRTFNSDGKAVFRGLATGVWALTMTNGDQSVTQNVTITSDYALTMAYFAATINVTYPAGSACSCTDGVTTLNAPDTTGAWTCVVPNTGTWTFTITDGVETRTDTVNITADGQAETLELSYRLWLFKSGEGAKVALTDYTETFGEVVFGTDAIEIKANSSMSYGALITSELLDLTKYNTLKVEMDVTQITSSYAHKTGISASVITGWKNATLVAEYTINNKGAQVASVDITNVDQGYFYFGQMVYGTISNIYCE